MKKLLAVLFSALLVCSCGAILSACGEPPHEHTTDDSGFCMTCDKPINYTKGIIYDVYSDGTCAEVIGYDGSSTKINIAPTYNNLPVKSLARGCFKDTNIIKVVIPDSVTSIGEFTFFDCSSLATIEIPDSVNSIGSYAFSGCSLTSIEIPNSVTSICAFAFSGCGSLTSVTFKDKLTWYVTYSHDGCVKKTGGSKIDITSPTGNAKYFRQLAYHWYKI